MNTLEKRTYQLVVKSSTEELSSIRSFLRDVASGNGVPQKTIEELILAVDEASTNIVKHAYHYSKDKEITVTVAISGSECLVTLIDHGDSFDPGLVPNPDMKQYLSDRKVGGLGLYLMRTLMDAVEYTSDGSANRLVLKKKLRA